MCRPHVVAVLDVHGTSVTFTCSGDYFLSRQPRQLLHASGVSQTICQKRDGIQEGEDTSSTRRLATVRSVGTLVRPIQEDRATSSTDMAEQVSDPTEVGKTSQEFVVVEQGQLLRAAETDQCALNVKASQFLKHPHSKREMLELTNLLPGSWYSACVYRRVADDLRRRLDSELECIKHICTDVNTSHHFVRTRELLSHTCVVQVSLKKPSSSLVRTCPWCSCCCVHGHLHHADLQHTLHKVSVLRLIWTHLQVVSPRRSLR